MKARSTVMLQKEDILDIFNYNINTGIFTWKKSRRGVAKGVVAGTLRQDGYVHLCIGEERHFAHRVVYLLMEGYMPEQVDHINGNRSDNRWENLRACTPSENSQNRRITNSKSGFKNVNWHEQTKKWRVQVMIDGKSRSFGLYSNIEDAKRVAIIARKEIHGDFSL